MQQQPGGYSDAGDGFGASGSGGWNQNTNPGPAYHPGQGSSSDVSGGLEAGQQSGSVGYKTQMQGGVKADTKTPRVVPVTIAEIVKSVSPGKERMTIANVDVQLIRLVAQVRECRPASTFITFLLDDKTGCTIEAKLWGNSQDELAAAVVDVGKYVRVHGTIKYMDEGVSVIVVNMQLVTDINEVWFHMVEVIHSHAVMEKIAEIETAHAVGAEEMVASGVAVGLSSTAGHGKPVANVSQVTVTSPDKMARNTSAQCGPPPTVKQELPTSGAGFVPDHLTPVQRAVYMYIRDGDDGGQNGTDIRPMYDALSAKFNGKEAVEAALDFLRGEGAIYTTIHDDHYKVITPD